MRQVLLQSATGITKCDNFITKCDDYYKVRQYICYVNNDVNVILVLDSYPRYFCKLCTYFLKLNKITI